MVPVTATEDPVRPLAVALMVIVPGDCIWTTAKHSPLQCPVQLIDPDIYPSILPFTPQNKRCVIG